LLKNALQNKTESGKNDKNEIKTQVIKVVIFRIFV